MRLSQANIPNLLVDRYRFREMLDVKAGREIWPSGAVTIMSFEFAKQDDVKESLLCTHWDLVVTDEWQGIKGARAKALRQIGAASDHVILASATHPNLELSDAFPANDTTVVEWRSDQIVDHDGNPSTLCHGHCCMKLPSIYLRPSRVYERPWNPFVESLKGAHRSRVGSQTRCSAAFNQVRRHSKVRSSDSWEGCWSTKAWNHSRKTQTRIRLRICPMAWLIVPPPRRLLESLIMRSKRSKQFPVIQS